MPPAPLIFMPLNVATPDEVLAVAPPSEPADGPLAIAAVTVVVGCPVITLPDASTTRTTGCVEKFVPTPTPPTGCVAMARLAAAPPDASVNVDDVALLNPAAVNVKVCVVGEITPVSVAAVNAATPEEVFADVVPPIVPGEAVTETLVAG